MKASDISTVVDKVHSQCLDINWSERRSEELKTVSYSSVALSFLYLEGKEAKYTRFEVPVDHPAFALIAEAVRVYEEEARNKTITERNQLLVALASIGQQ